MQAIPLSLEGLILIQPRVFPDERGFFYESYNRTAMDRLGLPPFVQDNISQSRRGVVRALHFQEGPGQAKLVSCLQGEIYDVAVDIRPGSPTFGRWESVRLNSNEKTMFFIPVGFAHGFCAMSEIALVQYKVSSLYDPALERTIRWNEFGIQWPVEFPILSERDKSAPSSKEIFGEILDSRR